MSTGTPPNTLKERLSKQMESETQASAVLINTHMKNFEDALKMQLQNAETTIENDIQTHLLSIRAKFSRFEERPKPIPRWLIACLMMGAISLSAWGIFAINRQTETSRFEEMGIYLNQTGETPLIIVDPRRLKMESCTISGRVYYCLKAREE